jgi:hypothetical protein
MLRPRSPLLAQSGHLAAEFQCPLLGVKRTLRKPSKMSASDPTRKSGIEICCRAKVQQQINAPRIQAPKRISRSLESIFADVYPQDYK